MGSRAFLLLGLLAVIALLISSEVAARDLAETSSDQKNAEATKEANEVDDAKYGGGYPGGGNGGYPGGGNGGYRGGNGGYGGGGHGGRGGYGGGGRCYHGCCRRGYYGRGCGRCCSYAGEAPDAETEVKPQN